MENKIKNNVNERTAQFGEKVIDFCQYVYQDVITTPIVHQMVKSATLLNIQYQTAVYSKEAKEYVECIKTCKKEAENTAHCLRMLSRCYPSEVESMREIGKECHELIHLFQDMNREAVAVGR